MSVKPTYEELEGKVKLPALLIDKMKELSLWHFLWMSIVASEIISGIIVANMSVLFRGRITYDYLITSAVSSFIVAAIVMAIVLYFVKQLREAELARRESEERYHEIFKSANVGLTRNRISDGKVLEANLRAAEACGYENLDEFISEYSFGENHVDPGTRERMLAELQEKGKVNDFEAGFWRKDGSILWTRFSARINPEKGYLEGVAVDITEEKRMMEALRESEERFRLAFDNANIGMCLVDLDGRLTRVNRQMCEIFGYNQEELEGMTVNDIAHPEDRDISPSFIQRAASGEIEHSQFEKRYFHKRGHIVWGQVSSSLVRDFRGEPLYFISHVQNITEHKRTEEALRESEEKYRSILKNIEEGYYEVDLSGNHTFFNDSLCRIFGYAPDEFRGINYRQLNDENSSRKLYDIYEKVHRTGTSVGTFDWEFKNKDGTLQYLEASASLMMDSEGKPIGFRGVVRDITDRKRAEEALRESEEKFKSLGENAPDIIYTLALDGSFTYVNPAWEAILGYEPEEVLGKYFVDFAKQEEARDYVRVFKRIRDKRKTLKDIDITIVHKDGSTRLFSASGAPNIDKTGEVTGMVGLFKDITDQRRLEAQFQQAQRMEAIGTLAGGIAHDFNNLLMGIQGRASLMLMEINSSHPHFEPLKGIEDYVKSAADLTKQLLGFARGGKYEVKPTDINELVNESSHMFGRTRKDIKINTKFQEDIWTVEVDHGQIEQVLLNLYVNAWQAMPGGGDLYLLTENVILDEYLARSFSVDPGGYVKISVTDTGVGMDEATQQRVFDPFFTTKGMGRGTGLGLASAYGIIKNHGGIINVYSDKGEGTTFNIYLPTSEKKISETKGAGEEILKGSETVLLVDDEKMIIDVGEQLLDRLGYKVMVAGSGNEALEMYEENQDRIDLVILDMIMPDMSGGDTYDKLKGINSSIKVLLASGYSINGQAQAILDRGCDAFIQKPFNLRELSKKVRSVLDKK
jgi:two-component system cell cycle sensor histidine kinase/response regulator CckA